MRPKKLSVLDAGNEFEAALPSTGRRMLLQASIAGAVGCLLYRSGAVASALLPYPFSVGFIESRSRGGLDAAGQLRQLCDSVVAVGADPWPAARALASLDLAEFPEIFGITGAGSFVILSQLAQERGYQLIYRGDHNQADPEVVQHRLYGYSPWIASVAASVEGTEDWAAGLGRHLRRGLFVPQRTERLDRTYAYAVSGRRRCDDFAACTSWAMATYSGR